MSLYVSLSASSSISQYRSVSAARYIFSFSLVFLSPCLSGCSGALSSGHTQHTSSNVQNIISFFALNIHITTHTSKPDGRREGTNAKKKKTCNSTEGVCPENSRNTNNASSAEASCRKELGRNSEKSVPNYNLGFRCKVTHYTREFSVFFFAWQLQNAGQSPRDHAQDLKC